jgi:hypothetical protein
MFFEHLIEINKKMISRVVTVSSEFVLTKNIKYKSNIFKRT